VRSELGVAADHEDLAFGCILRSKLLHGSADTVAGRPRVDQFFGVAVLTFSLIVTVWAARALLGVIVAGLGRHQTGLSQS
jgi:hypothetical protein